MLSLVNDLNKHCLIVTQILTCVWRVLSLCHTYGSSPCLACTRHCFPVSHVRVSGYISVFKLILPRTCATGICTYRCVCVRDPGVDIFVPWVCCVGLFTGTTPIGELPRHGGCECKWTLYLCGCSGTAEPGATRTLYSLSRIARSSIHA